MENYPYYKKTSCHVVKVNSENESIMITNGSEFVGYGIQKHGYIGDISIFKESNESEFLTAYNEVQTKLEELATK